MAALPVPLASSTVPARSRSGSLCSSFESTHSSSRDFGGRSGGLATGPGRSLQIRAGGRLAQFSFSAGLCNLFANAGSLRGSGHPNRSLPAGVVSLPARPLAAASPSVPALVPSAVVVEEATRPGTPLEHQGAGGRGRGRGHGEQTEQHFGGSSEDFYGGNLGFDPGYGGGRDHGLHRGGSCCRRWK
nr:unnamed protein product [Digitaria exilis]